MTNTCSICKHKDREEIDGLIVKGEPKRRIATRFNLSEASLRRHVCHISALLKKADYDIGKSIKCDIINIEETIKTNLEKAMKAEDLRLVHMFISDVLSLINTKAKISGLGNPQVQITNATQINILQSPEWMSLRSTIVRALGPYPEALEAVNNAIK